MTDPKTPAGAVRQRSRSGLTRCTKCRRHIVAGPTPATTVCPFCDGRGGRRSARGGFLAATMLAMACGGSETAPVEDPVAQEQSEGQEATDETLTNAEGSEEANEEDNAEGDTVVSEEPEVVPVPAYGAPPPEPDDDFEEQPAPDMQPMARYGLAPARRPQE
ncbi:MAG: hypothetical protein AAF938_23360 [Myxococcota bacterium]